VKNKRDRAAEYAKRAIQDMGSSIEALADNTILIRQTSP
jgi:hypothetical protein